MHTTKTIADRFGIHPQTIRRWTDQYNDHFSASAYNGDARLFTDDDLLVLWSIRRWRQLGYSLDDIAQRLSRGETVGESLPGLPADDEPPRALMITETVHTAALAEIKRLEADRGRLQNERDSALQKYDSDVTAFNVKINALSAEIGELRGKLSERQPTEHWLERFDRERRRWLMIVALAVVLAVIVTAALLLLAR